jgi:hypothetical protein
MRTTGLGTSYNLAVMGFGGFAQFIVTWLINVTGSPTAPAFYVMFGTAIGIIAAFFLVDRVHDVRLSAPRRRDDKRCSRVIRHMA